MVRLGLQLTLRSGREALVRALMIAVAVAIGVTVLLAVFADYHAYEATSNRACWECTRGTVGSAPSSGSELWNYSENIYKGRFIEVLDVAALGPKAPVVPGLPELPAAGRYYASPALAGLIKTVPPEQLGDRFPGSEVGTIGYQALSSPNELVAIVGYPTAKLAALPGTVTVDHIATAPDVQGTTRIYRDAFWVGAIMVLFPLLILVNTATRLAAARREERFVAMRLVGATGRQVNVAAAVESAVSAAFGTLLGIAAFLAVRPALAQISFSGARLFERTVTPTPVGYAGMLIGVPVVATVSSLWALRRVRVSPLGVSRKVTPLPPRTWRVLPLLVGVPVFIVPLLGGYKDLDNVEASPTTPLLYVGTFLIMAGLVLGGPWLTMQAARALARVSRGAASLLASRRLADNPKAAFRSVSGLVLAVFVGSLLASIVPVLNAAQTSLGGSAQSLTNVLRVPYSAGPGAGLPSTEAGRLLGELAGRPGVTVLAVYDDPSFQPRPFVPPPAAGPNGRPGQRYRNPGGFGGYDSVVSCASLRAFPALGRCAPGAKAVQADVTSDLLTDNPLTMDLPVVDHANPLAPASTNGLSLGALLVKTDNAATLEKVPLCLPCSTPAWWEGAVVPPTGRWATSNRKRSARWPR